MSDRLNNSLMYGRPLTSRYEYNDAQIREYHKRYPDACCADPDCPVIGVDPEHDLTKCESCHKGFCTEMQHIRKIANLWFCEACAICSYVFRERVEEQYSDNGPDPADYRREVTAERMCGESALVLCDECGELMCGDHLQRDALRTVCLRCAKKSAVPVVEAERSAA